MKKVIQVMMAVLICTLFLALLAGCNKSAASGQQGAAAPKAEIVWWQTASGPAEYYLPAAAKLVEQYNATNDKNTHVTIEHIGDNNYEMLVTAAAAGTSPDAAVGWTAQAMQFGLIGQGLPLNSIYDEWVAENSPIIDDISKEYFDFYTAPDGTLYGIPYRFDPRVITYRKDMFAQAGITKMPATWDEFIEVCRALKRTFPDKIPFIVGGGSFDGVHAVIGFGVNNGTGFLTPDLKPNINSKEWIEMLQFFGKLRAEELISPGSAGYTGSEMQRMFNEGEGAMIFGSNPSWIVGSELPTVCGVMPPLKGPSGPKQQTYAWINGSHAFASTKYPEETKAWLKWWAENNLLMFTEGRNSSLPMRRSFQSNAAYDSIWWYDESIACINMGCMTNAYPVPGLYLEFSQIEGEGIPAEPLRRVMQGDTNYTQIAEQWNQTLAAVFN